MFFSFFTYFSKFIFFSKARQKLIVLSVAGLMLSSFSLIVLQSTMGGLQNNLMERSKSVLGLATLYLPSQFSLEEEKIVTRILNQENLSFTREFEIELMLKYKNFLTPVIAHGIDLNYRLPYFLKKGDIEAGALPLDMAYKLELSPPEMVTLVSPTHVDSLFADIPRSTDLKMTKVFSTDVPEVDGLHLWVRLPLIQNLIHKQSINRLRIYSTGDFVLLKNKLQQFSPLVILKTWEEENNALVWALNLESTIMLFLFASMGLLISLSITSGLLIFFNKIKTDLSSFWILGASLSKINKSTSIFLHLLTLIPIFLGLILGLIFLYYFKKFAPEIMPDVFVDRKIPVLISMKAVLLSVLIPYAISSVFVYFSLLHFKKEHDPLSHLRSV